ncbi:MAG: tRNA uridine(34) 5-carboxymethylaminomethyl modification radical SAM/GNAT enzyme Elp3 [Candidatus Diapherotrites archaeon]|uniref:tRNA carboxymethyluridine synthase n=1 Tax=Candidatus Iainarchaeum sp. TaxID=3101447 RepID=A0A8T4L243_9ARCH|nr:tRNA uridine(34) 5-carboxymethylaminomethyl modification radical SAM/GNAT enzyme Elp3 [Candidatus Diapherotrites archaeon]
MPKGGIGTAGSDIADYSKQIISEIISGKISDLKQLNERKMRLSRELLIPELPKNPDILAYARHKTPKLISFLGIKPVRTLSGIAVVAVMPAPQECPGKCIYCPSGKAFNKNSPKSYTGFEPATMRALRADFDAFAQTSGRIKQLQITGHKTDKIELIVMGGTFPACKFSYQKKFIKECTDAVTGKKSRNLQQAQKNAETSEQRLIGITFETRPDYCGKREIKNMLALGATRVELGVQNIDDEIYRKIGRNHTVGDVIGATQLLKDSALKVCYHMMPGLPFSTYKKDLHAFREILSNPNFRPDMLKIYPCIVVKGTKLYELWKQGKYNPYTTEEAAKLIAEIKPLVPKWIRIMRIQRDIPLHKISAGVAQSNLRQIVKREMRAKNTKCRCIRCREAGQRGYLENEFADMEKIKILSETYSASNGEEIFISAEDTKRDLLLGFCRLRIPNAPFIKPLTERTALVRELHVYGELLGLGEKKPGAYQHKGFGKALLQKAEEIALQEYDKTKIAVMSGIGAREYYRKLGYALAAPYVLKSL